MALSRCSVEHLHTILYNLFLSSATVVAERLCFYRCLSVHREGGVVHPLGRPPLLGRHTTPWVDTPHPRWPLQRTVLILLECNLVFGLGFCRCERSPRVTLSVTPLDRPRTHLIYDASIDRS